MNPISAENNRQKKLADLLAYVRDRKKQNDEAEKDQASKEADVEGPATKKQKTANKTHSKKSALHDYCIGSDSVGELNMSIKSDIEVRPYQQEAVDAIVDRTQTPAIARSGIIVLPCGAGKTLTSILVASAIKKPVLVVCSTIIAAEQFSKEFLRFTDLMASKTGMFAGAKKWPYNGPSGVLFTTYTMLVDSKNRSIDSKRMSTFINKTEWGIVILDEVHCVPANNFAKAIAKIKTKVRLGLTATMLREDEKIGDLETLVGPTWYHAKWKELADKGYIAKVICTQVESEMTPLTKSAHDSIQTGNVLGKGHHLRSLLAILHPKKIQMCQRLVQYHEARGDKVLVYCDHIDALKIYAEKIDRPLIYGATPTEDARQLLTRFQIDINTLFLSRIGDTSLDLPAATVLIQVSSHFGSRRQEAQRLGRVLRAKKRNEKGFYSRFYTLVTNDTHEMQFSERRRQFLEEDCGYGYQIWKVGEEKEGGWQVEAHRDNSSPDDDEVKADPLTCTIRGAHSRPYSTDEEEKGLINFLAGLKNYVVEQEEDETDPDNK
ncbi:P-loop containing nucleoside triphosphate hydrolase protein [Sporodiniella umbellata]|nr:P-loop containing nucleoside triphosphate hydrolase protein [Sporodiniella umbellata]